MARSNPTPNSTLAHKLYDLADSIGPDSPRIGNFRVTDGLKALSVGLCANSTAECLNGRAMSGIYKTLQRIGKGLVDQHNYNCAVTPIYCTATNEGGVTALVYEPVDVVNNNKEIETILMPVKEKLQGFGFDNLAVYTTCMHGTQLDSQGPTYTHSALFSDSFYARGMDQYAVSPHCRPGDYPFHMEIVRGQLAMWAASKDMPDTSMGYTKNLLTLAEAQGVESMVRTFTQDLKDSKLEEFVTV